MGKRVIWKDRAKAQVRAIEQDTALRILRTLARFLDTGAGDVQRLQGIEPSQFRLRVGDYRVRFYDFDDHVQVLAVRHRREAYRGD